MKIAMAEGLEVTQEVESLAKQYNWFSRYIDDYCDRRLTEEHNLEIENKLNELGVINFEQ